MYKNEQRPINRSHWKLHVIVYLLHVLFVSSSSCSMNYLSYSCPYFSNVLTYCIRFMSKISRCFYLVLLFRSLWFFSSSTFLFWMANSILMNTLYKNPALVFRYRHIESYTIENRWCRQMCAIFHKNHTIFRFTFANLKILLLQMAYTLNHHTNTYISIFYYVYTFLILLNSSMYFTTLWIFLSFFMSTRARAHKLTLCGIKRVCQLNLHFKWKYFNYGFWFS